MYSTEEKAFSEPRDSTMNFYNDLLLQLAGPRPDLSPEANRERAARASSIKNMKYSEVFQQNVVYGTPDSVADRLHQLKEEFDLDGIVAEMNQGGLVPHDRIVRSINLLANDVMPRFK